MTRPVGLSAGVLGLVLAWFGGAPGAASALFLISLFDAASIVTQDAVLTVGAAGACSTT